MPRGRPLGPRERTAFEDLPPGVFQGPRPGIITARQILEDYVAQAGGVEPITGPVDPRAQLPPEPPINPRNLPVPIPPEPLVVPPWWRFLGPIATGIGAAIWEGWPNALGPELDVPHEPPHGPPDTFPYPPQNEPDFETGHTPTHPYPPNATPAPIPAPPLPPDGLEQIALPPGPWGFPQVTMPGGERVVEREIYGSRTATPLPRPFPTMPTPAPAPTAPPAAPASSLGGMGLPAWLGIGLGALGVLSSARSRAGLPQLYGAPQLAPPFADPLTPFNPSAVPYPEFATQSGYSQDRCNCEKTRKRKPRDCTARGQLRWASGPKKGKPAGSRCIRFAT